MRNTDPLYVTWMLSSELNHFPVSWKTQLPVRWGVERTVVSNQCKTGITSLKRNSDDVEAEFIISRVDQKSLNLQGKSTANGTNVLQENAGFIQLLLVPAWHDNCSHFVQIFPGLIWTQLPLGVSLTSILPRPDPELALTSPMRLAQRRGFLGTFCLSAQRHIIMLYFRCTPTTLNWTC